MDLRRIKYFLAVVDAGTVTAAALSLYIAQPALSRQIKALERELDLPLFESRGNRLLLTPNGRAFAEIARELSVKERDAERAVQALRTGRVDTLTCFTTPATARGFLSHTVAESRPDDPIILVQHGHHETLEDALTRGADFILTTQVPSARLTQQRLGPVPIWAFVHLEHPWALDGRREITLSELASQRIVLPGNLSTSRDVMFEAFRSAGVRPLQMQECEDDPTVQAIASAGHAVGVTTEDAGFPSRALRILPDRKGSEPLELALHVAWLPDHYAESVLESLVPRMASALSRHGSFALKHAESVLPH